MSIHIDVTDFVSAPEGQKSLAFTDERQQANFELGVAMHIHKWDTLNTAVQNGWGGQYSEDKRDWISGVVVDLFNDNRELDVFAIHEILFNAMEDEFEVFVEDDSTVLIAANIIKCYRDCAQQKYEQVQEMYQKWQAKQATRSSHVNHVHVEADPENPDSSDDDEDDDDEPQLVQQDQDEDMDTDEPPRGPIVDDDGFTLVTKGRRR